MERGYPKVNLKNQMTNVRRSHQSVERPTPILFTARPTIGALRNRPKLSTRQNIVHWIRNMTQGLQSQTNTSKNLSQLPFCNTLLNQGGLVQWMIHSRWTWALDKVHKFFVYPHYLQGPPYASPNDSYSYQHAYHRHGHCYYFSCYFWSNVKIWKR